MIATVYVDPTDSAIDEELACTHFRDALARLGLPGVDMRYRPDARIVGRRPLLVLDGGALDAGRGAS